MHSVALSEADAGTTLEKVLAVARGDGIVEIIDIEADFVSSKLKGSSSQRIKAQSKSLKLDYSLGGHTAAVASV